MSTTANPLTGFGSLRSGHALSGELDDLVSRAAADPLLLAGGPEAVGPVEVRRNLRVEPDRDGRWVIRRFSWCAKWRAPGGDGPSFRARTLLYEPERERSPRTYDFPDDPWLPAAAAAGGPLDAGDVEVLRYIPTRRITFRRGDAVVGKIKRQRTVARSYARLEAVHAAAHGAGFAVPEPMGLDAAAGVFYQRRMPGRSLQELVEPANAPALLGALGALHASLHALAVEGVPARRRSDVLAGVRADAAWIAFAVPAESGAVAEVERRIAGELDALGPGAPALCHGDPAIDQVLADGDALTIVDFDDAAIDDPYSDLGAMIAGLALDAPAVFAGGGPAAERAVAAYLEGYRERACRALDERRLRAHRLRAELAALANRLRKGRAGAPEAAAAVAALRAAARAA
jgi:aminoglycoside phosphotransferase (APT) family kinase protein